MVCWVSLRSSRRILSRCPSVKSLGDEELRQHHEEKLRDIFKEHNISEEKGFEIANEILDYVLKLEVEK